VHGERLARFALLPSSLFAASTIDSLEEMANAALHVEVEALRETAANTNVKVDAAIMQQATELRDRMVKTAEYNLGHKDSVVRELADIRLGTGYLDLANDCARLAALYTAHKSDLAIDKRFYDAADGALAASLAGTIRGEYRAAASRAGQYGSSGRASSPSSFGSTTRFVRRRITSSAGSRTSSTSSRRSAPLRSGAARAARARRSPTTRP